jgi:DNA-binding transcriptional LysR family regulator
MQQFQSENCINSSFFKNSNVINPRAAQTFLVAARLGSFRQAADQLHVSPSTVSTRVDELEGQLGKKLFDRVGRQVVLSFEGKKLVPYMEKLLAAADELSAAVGHAGLLPVTLRLGAVEVIALSWLPALLTELNLQHKEVILELTIAPTADLLRASLDGTLDLALLPSHIAPEDLETIPLGTLEWVWAIAPTLLPSEPVATSELISSLPLITLGRQSLLHRNLRRWLLTNDMVMGRLTVCTSINIVAKLTAAGFGISYLPVAPFEDDFKTGKLQRLAMAPTLMPFTYVAAYDARRSHPLAPSIACMAAEVAARMC